MYSKIGLRGKGLERGTVASENSEDFKLWCSERRVIILNRVLRRVFGHKRDEVTGEWRKLHNEEHKDLYTLPNIVRVINSRRMRWTGHVARMGRVEAYTGF